MICVVMFMSWDPETWRWLCYAAKEHLFTELVSCQIGVMILDKMDRSPIYRKRNTNIYIHGHFGVACWPVAFGLWKETISPWWNSQTGVEHADFAQKDPRSNLNFLSVKYIESALVTWSHSFVKSLPDHFWSLVQVDSLKATGCNKLGVLYVI